MFPRFFVNKYFPFWELSFDTTTAYVILLASIAKLLPKNKHSAEVFSRNSIRGLIPRNAPDKTTLRVNFYLS